MTPDEEIRELSGECAMLLRTLDEVRRIVYDRLDGHPTGRLLLDTVNTAYDKAPTGQARTVDAKLVEKAIAGHAMVMLTHMRREHIPQPGDLHPAYHQTMAAWHLARITALRAAPADLAAKILREEALTALDTTTKETPV